MYVFYSKNPNFFNSARLPTPFFKTKLTRTKQLIDCGLSVGMRGIKVGRQGIRVRTWGITVRMWGITVRMQVYKYSTGI